MPSLSFPSAPIRRRCNAVEMQKRNKGKNQKPQERDTLWMPTRQHFFFYLLHPKTLFLPLVLLLSSTSSSGGPRRKRRRPLSQTGFAATRAQKEKERVGTRRRRINTTETRAQVYSHTQAKREKVLRDPSG